MKPAFFRIALSLSAAGGMLAGCSQGGAPAPSPAQQQAQANAAAAGRDLATYRELLRIHNDQMAVSMGQDIVDRYPGTAAATEVQRTLPGIEQRYRDASEKYRLASLWVYQVSPMAGGTQSTAAIYSSQPAGNDRVQLVLRRHTSWGESAYLYGGGHGFVCHASCVVPATVDGKPVRIKAFAPTTGEPALLFNDQKAFVAMLRKAKKISLQVTLADGEKKQTLVYEVGGFQPDRWAPLPKGTKGPKKK